MADYACRVGIPEIVKHGGAHELRPAVSLIRRHEFHQPRSDNFCLRTDSWKVAESTRYGRSGEEVSR